MSTAFIFPGQGSQYVGMAKDMFESNGFVRDIFANATAILGYNLAEICFHGPEEKLKQTYVTQPAIFVHSYVVTSFIKDKISASLTAGHSLGEFSALVYAGVLTFENGLKLVKLRSELMQRAGEINKGTMAAVVGIDESVLASICNEASAFGVVQIANLNSPGQIVISGSVEGVRKAMEIAKQHKAKLVKELVVHGAFHSPLMSSAKEELRAGLEEIPFQKARIPVYSNVTSKPITNETEHEVIKNMLYEQLTSPVRWEESICNMISDGVTEFIEMGPGKVLQGLVKRINPNVKISGFDKIEEIKSFLNNTN